MQQRDRHGDVAHARVFLNVVEQERDALCGKGFDILRDGGKARGGVLPDGQTVEADDGHILGHAPPCIVERADRAERHDVRHGEDRRKVATLFKQCVCRAVAVGKGEANRLIVPLGVKCDAVARERIHTATQTELRRVRFGGITADHGDFFMPERDQMLNRHGCGEGIVTGYAGKILEAKICGIVRDKHTGNDDLIKISGEVLFVTAEEKNAQRLLLAAELDGTTHLVAVFVDVVNDQRIAGLCDVGLHCLDKATEKFVGCTLDEHEDRIAVLLFELLGYRIELEAIFFRRAQDRGAGFFTYVGLIVQHT